MVYGTKVFKNGNVVGELVFSTGKRIFLNKQETIELENKINMWQYIAEINTVKYLDGLKENITNGE